MLKRRLASLDQLDLQYYPLPRRCRRFVWTDGFRTIVDCFARMNRDEVHPAQLSDLPA